MSRTSHSPAMSLLVRDSNGRYRRATVDQILEAARRVVDRKMKRGHKFESPTHVKTYLMDKLGGFEHEVFAVLFLDNKHRLIEYVEMFRGTIDGAHVYPREIVKKMLQINAAAVILAHNHPSGGVDPSGADRAVTRRIQDALALIDARVLDHIIVAGNKAIAFAEERWL
ncbi:TPA: DNA repair protein RadC [Stenotrophomonas maltophilia]|nr:DNA repair protein RadC [Stenotrophomonas maltophilia]